MQLMKRKRYVLSILLLSAIVALAMGVKASYAKDHADEKTQLMQCLTPKVLRLAKTTQVGLIAEDLTNGELLYSQNATQSFLPASVIKLVTAIAALAYLPEDYQFKTRIGLVGKQVGQLFSGQAYIKFAGDPSFKSDYLTRFVEKLYAQGVRRFNGNIIVDRHDFTAPDAAPGWLVDNMHICYAAPINALILDENCRRTEIFTEDHKVIIKPEFPLSFSNQVKISDDMSLPCRLEIGIKPGNHVVFYGCMQPQQSYRLALAVRDPLDYLAQRLQQVFKQQGITWQGKVREGSSAKQGNAFIYFHSQPLGLMIEEMLATSNNIIAEALLKKLGQLYYHQPGSFTDGIAAIKAILTDQLHLDTENWLLYDGSGLSRYNQVTPEQFNQLLIALYKKPMLYKKVYAALPRLGVNGRLVYYSVPRHLKGKIRGKTGSMQGVSNLVSIVKLSSGHDVAVSLFLSPGLNKFKNYRKVQMNLLDCFA
ncbi:D-alanyl-D-alanine carboxypeptidase DacB precursor [Piscirickettsia salmonis]|nr:D-alanyl-D-alanine carboxypeptidase DacB precursor [Piscirickettsia salmonis]QGP57648.1 D-alanyl-D-alanine carboxypeptidase DacB precursor [Piscirickettsia salmonis]QGP62353.1 D-alanyl-D-alanine carboxypeptidase DacB precursor [Piscirickettsia salmonis]